jgi:hypothetical protein
MVAGSDGAAIHPAAAPREAEPIVVKDRISRFGGADLEMLVDSVIAKQAAVVTTAELAGTSPGRSS